MMETWSLPGIVLGRACTDRVPDSRLLLSFCRVLKIWRLKATYFLV